jgi:hypothetical protein
MIQKHKIFCLVLSLMFFITMGTALQGFSLEEQKSTEEIKTQIPEKNQKLNKRPERYPTALAGLEVLADLTVTPLTFTGSCPAKFTFKGKITVNRPTVLQYRFIRSDNTRHSLGVLEFKEAGTKEVTDVWEFDDITQLPNIKGWEAIQVNFPMKVRSQLAYINGTCTDYKGGAPTQESAKQIDPSKSGEDLSWPVPDPQLPPVKR